VFHMNVAKVDRGCCNNGCIRMLQVSVPNISSVCKCVSGCFICCIHML
jgi:hypothetical protein